MDRDGVLTAVPEVARRNHQIQLRAITDLAVVLIAASHGVWKEAAVIAAALAVQEAFWTFPSMFDERGTNRLDFWLLTFVRSNGVDLFGATQGKLR